MTPEERRLVLAGLTRPQRLILKRAYGKSVAKPLVSEGPTMARVAGQMVQFGYLDMVRAGYVLSRAGFALAVVLRAEGWPDCERPKSRSSG